MAGLIPQSFIDDLISRADIVEIVNARVPLKRKGKEYSACCPFHNEKTPSFTVSENKQFYHCFGCGAHGTALGFLMEFENLDFIDAIEALAAEYNLDVPRENNHNNNNNIPDNASRDKQQALYDIVEKVAVLFEQQLRTSDKAIQYLKGRELTGDIAKTYRMGYAPDGWNFLTDQLGSDTKTINALVATGLIVDKGAGKFYDRFRDRITFPITDRRGRVIGFGGRVIDQGEPKYLNSPENEIFHKGLELYGLYEARRAVKKLERIIVVEGYMDVVALAQHGIEYAVASLGTATTKEQIQKTFRTVPEIIFCYDGDSAGLKAAWRALENTLPIIRDGHIAKFLFLPEKEDPDSMVRKEGKEKFEQRIAEATTLSDFMFTHLLEKTDANSMDGKASLAKEATPLLTVMHDSVFKDLLYTRLSELVGLPVEKLLSRDFQQPKTSTATHNKQNVANGRQIKHSAAREANALLLQYPSLAKHISLPEEFINSDIPGLSLFCLLYKTIMDYPEISSSALLERGRSTENFGVLQKLLQHDVLGTDQEQDRIAVFNDAIKNLRTKIRDKRFEILQDKMTQGGTASLNANELQEYKRHIQSTSTEKPDNH